MTLIKREDAIECVERGKDAWEAIDQISRLPSAEAEPTVIRSRTLMPTKDFKEWAKRIREVNPNAVVIPCDAEIVSADAVSIREDGTLEVKVPNAHKVGRVLVMDTDSHIGGGLFYPDDAEAVEGCDGCRYNTRIPQKQCLRCERYWRDSYERKGGDEE